MPRPPNTSAVAAIAAALIPMLATPPARMFAANNMLVCVLLLALLYVSHITVRKMDELCREVGERGKHRTD